MIIELIELIKSWPTFAQVTCVILLSGMGTLVVLAAISMIGDFVNGALVVLLRGYNPYSGSPEEMAEEDSSSEKKH